MADDSTSGVGYPEPAGAPGRGLVGTAVSAGLAAVEGAAFWAGALLPAVYLPVLLVGALSPVDPTPGLWLLLAHAAALVAGHRHGR